jgi:hypothetical protein
MSHRWASHNRPDDGSYAQCDWCLAGAYAQAEAGKVVIRYRNGIFSEEVFDGSNEEPPCGGVEGVFADHDWDYFSRDDGSCACRNCGQVIGRDELFSDGYVGKPCLEKKP